jgi:hypothetical protein
MSLDWSTIIIDYNNYRKAYIAFNGFVNFKNLISEASILSVVKPQIDEIYERKRPAATNA